MERAEAGIVVGGLRAEVELDDDAVAALASVESYAVGGPRPRPAVMPLLMAADDSGMPGVFRRQSAYPFRQDEESITG